MSFTRPFLLGPVFFRTAFPCSGGYHMERGGMPLHDAVGINCKKGSTILKIKAQVSSIWAKGSILMTVCVFYLTCHTTPPWCREKVMIYWLNIYFKQMYLFLYQIHCSQTEVAHILFCSFCLN